MTDQSLSFLTASSP